METVDINSPLVKKKGILVRGQNPLKIGGMAPKFSDESRYLPGLPLIFYRKQEHQFPDAISLGKI